nr:hypothetical protein GCM10025732_33060 [Glycomyces mayteni]
MFDMNPLGRSTVHRSPDSRAAASDPIIIAVTAFSGLPTSVELPDNCTTRSTPAPRSRSYTPGMSANPGSRNAPATPPSHGSSDSGRSRSPTAASTPSGSAARPASRTSAFTRRPRAASARTTSAPTFPVAPATR